MAFWKKIWSGLKGKLSRKAKKERKALKKLVAEQEREMEKLVIGFFGNDESSVWEDVVRENKEKEKNEISELELIVQDIRNLFEVEESSEVASRDKPLLKWMDPATPTTVFPKLGRASASAGRGKRTPIIPIDSKLCRLASSVPVKCNVTLVY